MGEEQDTKLAEQSQSQLGVSVNLNDLQSEYLKKQVEEGQSISDIANDFAKAKVTSEIIFDEQGEYEKLHKELAEEQKETLLESFKHDKIKKQAETLTEKQKKAEAFYISFRPILEFDFSNLVKKKKDEEIKQTTYRERSYGIALMRLMICLFIVPYCLFSFVLAIFNGINSIFEGVATFGKVARVIATSVLVIFIIVLFGYIALLCVDLLFGTNIMQMLNIK